MSQLKNTEVPPNTSNDVWEGLPVLEVTEGYMNSLPEYSLTLPTGKIVGKRWKKNLNCGKSRNLKKMGGGYESVEVKPEWVICEYTEHPNPELLYIQYYRPYFGLVNV